ncbi:MULTISPECIES: sigma factor-like helix-turn-helix DNA-binding protein [unclassified Streptomyces]|uniref:sigma factor-like helix-turn-helix DNA-binding protein n=1 Tax=unclassified Streptomyces TaxID=2593676 RepID=UPI0038030F32
MVEDRGIPEPAVAGSGCRSELEEREDIRARKPHLAELGDREGTLFEVRFGAERTQPEIGAELGLSRMHVSRLLAGAYVTLREGLLAEA